MLRRHELTDAQWEAIRDRLPGKASDPGVTAKDNRLFVNAVLFMAMTGIAWPDLPERFGKHDSVRKRFDRWCASGVWERLRDLLPADLTELLLDSTSVKAHPVSSTGRREAGEKKSTPTAGVAWAEAAAG